MLIHSSDYKVNILVVVDPLLCTLRYSVTFFPIPTRGYLYPRVYLCSFLGGRIVE